MKEKKSFKLERINEDGSHSEPEIHKIEELDFDWKMDRRGFLKTTAFGVTAITLLKHTNLFAADKKTVKPVDKVAVNNIDVKVEDLAHDWGGPQLALSRNEKVLASMSSQIKIWDFPSGKLLNKFDVSRIVSFALNEDGTLLALGDSDGIGYIKRTSDGATIAQYELDKRKEDDLAAFLHVAAYFTGDGKTAVFKSVDDVFVTWDGKEFTRHEKLKLKYRDGQIHINNDFSRIVYHKGLPNGDNGFSMVDTVTCKDIYTYKYKGLGLLGLDFNGDYSQFVGLVRLYTNQYDWDLRFFDSATGKVLKNFNMKKILSYADTHFVLALTPDGTKAIIGHNNPVTVIDTTDGKVLFNFVNSQDTLVTDLAVTGDSNRVIVSYISGSIVIYDLTTKKYYSLFDAAELEEDKKRVVYTVQESGRTVTRVYAENTPLPEGAICTCNSVSGTKPRPSSGGGGSCTCNQICTCVPIK